MTYYHATRLTLDDVIASMLLVLSSAL